MLASLFAAVPKAIASDRAMQVHLGDSPVIPIAQGQGVTITFIPSRQIVQKVWLDNPNWLTLDADGCLSYQVAVGGVILISRQRQVSQSGNSGKSQ
jgi:hypothetical protein